MENIPADAVTGAILTRFRDYTVQRGCGDRYAGKVCQYVKTVILWGCQRDHLQKNPLETHRVKVQNPYNTTHVTVEELQLLETFPFEPRLQKVVDCYLFSCYTGLAYQDAKNLTAANVVEKSGRKCLDGIRQKTGTPFFVPIVGQAERIINKYGGVENLPIKSNKEMNMLLKIACVACGINKQLWYHTARKTFADLCVNVWKLHDNQTIGAMGQKDVKELDAYRSIRKEMILDGFPT